MTFPPIQRTEKHGEPKQVGIIGCGKYSYAVIAYYLRKNYGDVIRASYDIDKNKSASLFQDYNLKYYSEDYREILNDDKIGLIFIASNHASHADYAIEAIKRGKAVHIEKPHIVNRKQLDDLCAAVIKYNGIVNIGFNRSNSMFGIKIKDSFDSQNEPGLYTWFVTGHAIPKNHWYYDEKEGGRIFGNVCHWIEFIYNLMNEKDIYPITINTASSPNSENLVLQYIFGDGTISNISFTESNSYDGVKEWFVGRKGRVLASLECFKKCEIETNGKKQAFINRFWDHGHEDLIKRSYGMLRNRESIRNVQNIYEIGDLILKSKESLALGRTITVENGFKTK
jgi:predicted dehydrogenase